MECIQIKLQMKNAKVLMCQTTGNNSHSTGNKRQSSKCQPFQLVSYKEAFKLGASGGGSIEVPPWKLFYSRGKGEGEGEKFCPPVSIAHFSTSALL
jgi:hypothetical protein